MSRFGLPLSLLLVLTVSACTFGGDRGREAPVPDPATYEPLPPPQPGAAGQTGTSDGSEGTPSLGAVNQGGTYPYGAVPEPGSSGAGDSGADVVVRAPDGSLWRSGRGTSSAQYQADAGACYQYAQAQTRHDSRIYDDRNAASDTLTANSRFAQVQQQREEYGLHQRRFSLMEDCMRSRGYFRL